MTTLKNHNIYTTQSHTTAIGAVGQQAKSSITSIGSLSGGIHVQDPWAGQTLQTISSLDIQKALNISIENLHHTVKKYEVYESPYDVLALSVAWKRLRDNKQVVAVSKLLDGELFKYVTEQDHVDAKEIREYYSKKIMVWSLKNIRLTPYRTDLKDFINNTDGKIVKENMLSLVYRLPEFHDYDLELDEVRGNVSVKQGFSSTGRNKISEEVVSLSPIKRLHRKTKTVDTYQYWLKDESDDSAVLLTLRTGNPLQHIWDHFFQNTKVLNLKGLLYTKTLDDFEYFSIKNWTLENI